MIVEKTDELKEWLINELEREGIDADASAVALYAVALVRKDAPEQELKPTVISDLSVFLQENTEAFVERLFQAVKDKTYLQPSQSRETTTDQENTETSTEVSRQESKTQDSDDELSDDDRDHRRTRRSRSRSVTPPQSSARDQQQRSHRISPHRRLGYNSRGGGNTQAFQRGGYQQRGARRGNVRSRVGFDRGGYNGGGDRRGYERDRPRGRSPPPRRSLSPQHRRRSRSRSPRRSLSPHRSQSPIQRSRSPLDLLATLDKPGAALPVKPKRCRDYDEKGYCLQGDLCPFSHGTDAVVMTDVASLGLKSGSAPNNTQSQQGQQQAQPIAQVLPTQQNAGPPIRPPVMQNIPVEPYNPEVPRMWRPPMGPAGPRPGMRPMGPGGFMPGGSRFPPGGGPPRMPPHHMQQMRMPRGAPPHGFRPRGGYPPHHQQMPGGVIRPTLYDPNRATLEIKNLPAEFNTIAKLNDHFSKFGTIVNLQVQYLAQPDTALVTFSTNEEAKGAHNNPEPLFNNRFIKIFWHKDLDENQANNGAVQGGPSRPSAKSRLGTDVTGNAHEAKKQRVEPNMDPAKLRLNNSAPNPTSRKVSTGHGAAAGVSKKSAEQLNKQKQLEMKKQQLLLTQLNQQKSLFDMMDKCKTAKEKNELAKTIKQLQGSIDRLKADLSTPAPQQQSKVKTDQAKAAEKELLDAEMDIHQRAQAGEDTAAMEQRLDNLRRKATSMGLHPTTHRGGRGGRGRGGHVSTRPQKPAPPTGITVMGFKPEEKDAVVSHFSQFGDVQAKDLTEGPPTSIVIEYSKPNDAKVASIHGVKFNGKNLIMKWYKPSASAPANLPDKQQSTQAVKSETPDTLTVTIQQPAYSAESAPSSTRAPLVKSESLPGGDAVLEDQDDLLAGEGGNEEGDIDDALLLGDDDEDDDEKRSW